MPVLVLQPLAVQRGPSGGAAEQEAARPAVAGRPGEVADPLEAEHRVVDVEGDHRHAVHRVGGRRGDPVGHRAGLVDALLQHLAVLALLVVAELVGVLRRVELPLRVVDAELAEHALHAEGAALVRHDRHDVLADLLVAAERVQRPDEGHRRRDLPVAGVLQQRVEQRQVRDLERRVVVPAHRERPAERIAPLQDVVLLLVAERDVGRLGDLALGHRDVEAVAERLQLVLGELLLLVGDVLALAGIAHAVALDGLDEEHGRLAVGLHRPVEGRVDLLRIMPAAAKRPDLGVGPVLDQLGGFRVLAEEMLADVGAVARLEGLVVAVDGLVHQLPQLARVVLLEQLVPARAPDQLDDVPAGAAEGALQLLDDLAVAPHRPVEPLQVAVDDEDQVVEPSRAASPIAPRLSGSSISPSPRKAQTLRSAMSIRPRLCMYFMNRAW